MLCVPAAHPSQYGALTESPLIAHVGQDISGEVLPEIVAWLYTHRVDQDGSCCGTGTRAVVPPAELQSRPAGPTALGQFPQRFGGLTFGGTSLGLLHEDTAGKGGVHLLVVLNAVVRDVRASHRHVHAPDHCSPRSVCPLCEDGVRGTAATTESMSTSNARLAQSGPVAGRSFSPDATRM